MASEWKSESEAGHMQPEEAVERINKILAHAWMVRTFLKHSEELQDDEELLEVHRMIFDYVRALEPSYQRKDIKDYLRRAKGKLPKLRRVAELFAREFRRISDHTNYQMAAVSLTECVRQLDEILNLTTLPAAAPVAHEDDEPASESNASEPKP
jgi:hypothetical protein